MFGIFVIRDVRVWYQVLYFRARFLSKDKALKPGTF